MIKKVGIVMGTLALGASAAGVVFWSTPSSASAVDALRVLGLESSSDWTPSSGGVLSESPIRSQGETALKIETSGYTAVTSRLVGPLGDVADTISFDLQLPADQPDPYWQGATQLYVSIPSQGIYEEYLGQKELTGLAPAQFHQFDFPLNPSLRETMSGSYYDLQFKVVLNVPGGVTGGYLLDNLQVSSTIPGRSTISHADLPRIFGFEAASDWSTPTGSVGLASQPNTQGNTSLSVDPAGFTVVTSVPMTDIGLVNEEIGVDIWIPAEQPNPSWWGSVQLLVNLPSQGLYNQFIGQQELTGKEVDAFNTLTFSLSPAIQAVLNSDGYSDLQFSIVLNLPQGAERHYIDNLSIGAATEPPAPVSAAPRGDYVGRTSSGVVFIMVDDRADNPALGDAIFRVKSEDGNCVPNTETVCRYLLSVVRVRTGPFHLGDADFDSALLRNADPIRFSLGGSHGFSVPIPSQTRFNVWTTDAGYTYVGAVFPLNLSFSMAPAGAGFMSLTGSFEGTVNDRNAELIAVITADSPLVNRIPEANAGPDVTASSSSGPCSVDVDLDGSSSSDPDSNVQSHLWYWNNMVIADGDSPTVSLTRSGTYPIELRVRDSFGSYSYDSMVAQVSLPNGCPTL